MGNNKFDKEIVIHDSSIKVAHQKSHFIAGLGILAILFGLISFGYKSGSHGVSDTFTWTCLIIGAILIAVDFMQK